MSLMEIESKVPTRGSPLKTKSLTNNELIGKYMLGAELGRGAFGAVYRGLDTVSGKTVAIKQMKLEKGQQQSTLQREIEFMKQFEHENILQYYESIVVKNKINIVIEYMENGSLSDIIEQFGVFPEPLVATYLFQVLTGLQFLHENNVIHKDIKAANILLAKDGTIKLADFGIAYQISEDHNTPIKGIQGSPFWMSPEVITNDSTPTTKSDIWSIGCTIIELLMGSPPWGTESAVSVVWKIVEGDITSQYPPIVTNELKDLLDGCFERSVSARPSAETLLKHPWIAKFSLGSFKRSLADLRKTVQQHTRKSMMFGGLRSVPASPLKPTKEYSKEMGEDTPLLFKTPETTPVSTVTSVDEQLNLGLDIRGISVFFLETISKNDGPKSWTEYVVKVSLGPMKWRIEKRYSQFRALHENFKSYHPKVVLPTFPPKQTFGNLDPKFVLERRNLLQHYMDQMLSKPEVLACPEVKCFLIGD